MLQVLRRRLELQSSNYHLILRRCLGTYISVFFKALFHFFELNVCLENNRYFFKRVYILSVMQFLCANLYLLYCVCSSFKIFIIETMNIVFFFQISTLLSNTRNSLPTMLHISTSILAFNIKSLVLRDIPASSAQTSDLVAILRPFGWVLSNQ